MVIGDGVLIGVYLFRFYVPASSSSISSCSFHINHELPAAFCFWDMDTGVRRAEHALFPVFAVCCARPLTHDGPSTADTAHATADGQRQEGMARFARDT